MADITQDKPVEEEANPMRPASQASPGSAWAAGAPRDAAPQFAPKPRAAASARAVADRPDRSPGRPAVITYLAASVLLIVALAGTSLAGPLPPDSGSPDPAYVPIGSCVALLGIAYYLGRSRPTGAARQRLNLLGKFWSAVPLFGMLFIPHMRGLTRLTRRRLYLRNLAIFLALVPVNLLADATSARSVAPPAWLATVLALLAPLLAAVMALRLPAAGRPDRTARRRPEAATPLPSGHPTSVAAAAPSAATPPPTQPQPADRITDVTDDAALARRLYWLCGAMKFGAVFIFLGMLAPNGPLQLTWPAGIAAGAAMIVDLAFAVLLQEGRMRPTAAVAWTGILICLVCFIFVVTGPVAGAAAGSAAIGWALWTVPGLWLYRRRRSSRRAEDRVLAASRTGHLPSRRSKPTGRRSFPAPSIWIKAASGLVLAVPIVLLGLINTVVGVPIISDWIQAPLDKLYWLARWLASGLPDAAQPSERPRIALASSREPNQWQLLVRGDLLHWGKLGPQRVGFEEFLKLRLETYAEVQSAEDTQAKKGSEATLIALPGGTALAAETLEQLVDDANRVPLVTMMAPVTNPAGQWTELATKLAARGDLLPDIADPPHTIAVLHLPAGENIAYLARARHQWSYCVVIYQALLDAGIVIAPGSIPGGRVAGMFPRPAWRATGSARDLPG